MNNYQSDKKKNAEIDRLYMMAKTRIKAENPDIRITEDLSEKIWWSIAGIYNNEGYDKALEYVNNAKINIYNNNEEKIMQCEKLM